MNLTLVRTGATALISIAVAMQTLHPSYTWIAVVVAAASAVGIHAIPAVTQAATAVIPTVVKDVTTMADNDHAADNPVGAQGSALMGVTPPVAAQKTAEVPAAPVAPPTLVTPVVTPEPDTTPVETPVASVPATPVETAQKTAQPVTAPVADNGNAELASIVMAASEALAAVAKKLA